MKKQKNNNGKHLKNPIGSYKNKLEFSKALLIQESILIWIHTIALLILAYICVLRGAYAELPWLTAMVALPWTAYAVSQHAYYKKAEAQNTKGGITYETVMMDYHEILNEEYFDTNAVG